MASVRMHSVSFAYRDDVPVLRDVDLDLSPGFTALVGANGAGKTTLLRLLAGELRPDHGSIAAPDDVVLCPQEVAVPDDTLLVRDDGLARTLRARLRVDDAMFARWPTLSPGERKRFQIGGALAREPEVLLLDEPTNHIDAECAALLFDALRRYRGVGVVVTHDRALLASLPRAIVRVERSAVRVWNASWDVARASWERERVAAAEAYDEARAEERSNKRALADMRRRLAGIESQRSTAARMKDKNDSDARGIHASFRVARADARVGRAVARAREKLETTVLPDKPPPELGRELFLGFSRAPSSLLASEPIVLRREDRIRVVGPNGAGKTTLLRALVARMNVRAGYLPQELSPEEIVAVLDDVRALERAARGRVLSLLAALGVDPGRVLASARPSPGEARKLAIAQMLGTHAAALVLDEPTNHLDLPSIERIERALEHYPGALVLVTHDDAFAARCTTRSVDVGARRA